MLGISILHDDRASSTLALANIWLDADIVLRDHQAAFLRGEIADESLIPFSNAEILARRTYKQAKATRTGRTA